MTEWDSSELEKLSQAFGAVPDGASPSHDCPDPEAIWDAANGALDASAVTTVVDHIRTCVTCAEAWRVAIEVKTESTEHDANRPPTVEPVAANTTDPAPGGRSTWTWVGLAVAAAGLLLLALPTRDKDGGETIDEVYRTGSRKIRSLGAESASVDNLELRWSAVDDVDHYEVEVLTVNLVPVAQDQAIRRAMWKVPRGPLQDLPRPTSLLWRVEAVTRAGTRVASETFTVELVE